MASGTWCKASDLVDFANCLTKDFNFLRNCNVIIVLQSSIWTFPYSDVCNFCGVCLDISVATFIVLSTLSY